MAERKGKGLYEGLILELHEEGVLEWRKERGRNKVRDGGMKWGGGGEGITKRTGGQGDNFKLMEGGNIWG